MNRGVLKRRKKKKERVHLFWEPLPLSLLTVDQLSLSAPEPPPPPAALLRSTSTTGSPGGANLGRGTNG